MESMWSDAHTSGMPNNEQVKDSQTWLHSQVSRDAIAVTKREVKITTETSHLQLDLVAFNSRKSKSSLLVLVPTIIAAGGDFDISQQGKAAKYTNKTVKEWLDKEFSLGEAEVEEKLIVTGIFLDTRGAWCDRSYNVLRDCGLSIESLEQISITVLQHSVRIWKFFMRGPKKWVAKWLFAHAVEWIV